MRPYLLFICIAMPLMASHVEARSVQASSNMMTRYTDRSLDFTSDTTTSIRNMKVVMAARPDAASFVASEGSIRGAQLEAALMALRAEFPEAHNQSDMALAQAILAL